MGRNERIRKFNQDNEPFYLVDHGDSVSLCFVFAPTPSIQYLLGQEAFNRYAEQIGEPAEVNGIYTHGNGYEWDLVFQKAFEQDADLSRITFDSEMSGFFCRGDSLEMMERLGREFRAMCNDTDAFTELVCKAISERELQEVESHDITM